MKWYRKFLAIFSFCTILTTTNCFAIQFEDTKISDDKITCYRTYQVMETEQNMFLDMLPKEIEIDNNKYEYINYKVTGGNTSATIDINTTKTITSKSKDINSILEQLEEKIKYEKDGYIGEYILNPNTLKITTNYNGFREDLIEETINYTNLEKNDLEYIPKQTTKSGMTLNLLKIDWEVETTKMMGDYKVPNTYIAKCYYAEKQRVDYPNTYTVTAEYFGTATKTEEHPITYTVEYKKLEKEIEEKKVNNVILPIASGSTGIILVIIFFITRNVTVYNLKDGQWVKVGKTRVSRNKKIKLDRFCIAESTNKYKLTISKGATRKLKGELVIISKRGNSISLLVKTSTNKPYTFEIRI